MLNAMQDDIATFLATGEAVGWKQSTRSGYAAMLNHLAGFLRRRGCCRSPDVVPGDLEAYQAELRAQGRAKGGRIRNTILVRRYFAWLQEQGRILANPARGLPLPEDGEEDLPEAPLEDGVVSAILAALPRESAVDLRNVCLLELVYGCGLRISEALHLDVDDLDLEQRTVQVREGKHGQNRLLPVMPTALAAAKDYLAVRRSLLKGPDHGALLLNRFGRRMGMAAAVGFMNRLNQQRGPGARHLHFHLFRHSIAVHLLQRGADVRCIQRFLGHASLDTTKIYLRLVPGRLAEDYRRAMPEIEVGSGEGGVPDASSRVGPGR